MLRSDGVLRRRYGSESEGNNHDSYVVGQPLTKVTSAAEDSMAFAGVSGGGMASANGLGATTSGRDRTAEFVNTVRSFQGRQLNGRPSAPSSGRAAGHAQLARQSGEFMKIARSIGRDIANTYTKLEKLTLLARRKTLFDDRPKEIQELTFIIKEDMNMLNRQIGQLQQIARAQRSQGLQGKHQQSHSSTVVVALQSKLATMTNSFKDVLEVRTENLKESRNRQEMFTQGGGVGGAVGVTTSLPQSAIKGFHSGSVLQQAAMEDDERQRRQGDFSISMDQQQSQSLLMADQTDQYLQSRSDAMQSIESTIVELGGIFSQLAHMIKEQEEIMVRIDSNVDDAALNVEAGHGEILKYFQSVTSNRWLMVKVFGVLIFFFIFFVIFMA